MKLEDITLISGDMITFENGDVIYVNLLEATYLEDTVYDSNKDNIVKIERYEQRPCLKEYSFNPFELITIWKREKSTNDGIEEINFEKGMEDGEYTKYFADTDKIIIDKLNEIIRKVNKLGKSE